MELIIYCLDCAGIRLIISLVREALQSNFIQESNYDLATEQLWLQKFC